MSKKKNDFDNETQEPWEQPIYDTDDETTSRTQQRRQKRGTSKFLVILVILLSLCILVPAGFVMWLTHDKKNADSTPSTASSSLVSSTKESSTNESSTSESSTTETSESESSSSSSEESVPSSTSSEESVPSSTENNQQDQQNAQAGEQYITVQNGEGPNQVAARAGISVDQLYQLNGIDPNNFLLYPGQQLRIK